MPLISLLTLSITFPSRICISISSTLSSLMRRSTLLMKRTGRTCSLSACLSTVSVWGMVPSTASTRTTAPSTARIARVTSPPKSTCPGVSIMLMRYSCPPYSCTIDTLLASMVIPRACSSSSESIKSCFPASSSLMIPAPASRLSERVVFPWSICATIPIFRICSGWFISSFTRSMDFLPRAITTPQKRITYRADFAIRSRSSFLFTAKAFTSPFDAAISSSARHAATGFLFL
ncbi:MAG: hypothetical protein BWY93_02191 [Euryarchaeota archaeon ADurb.BinA087]|nr:MAG: hypothetical protein BWY93_02191 [Euryarchaeota archaeon ADurb.BinA087]